MYTEASAAPVSYLELNDRNDTAPRALKTSALGPASSIAAPGLSDGQWDALLDEGNRQAAALRNRLVEDLSHSEWELLRFSQAAPGESTYTLQQGS